MLKLIFILVSLNSIAMAESLSLKKAQAIMFKALDCAHKNKWKVSISVVNNEGNLIAFNRDDGAYVGSIKASMDKARASNNFHRPTSAFADALKEGRTGLLTLQEVVAIEGGQPIIFDGEYVGAIGVSGAKALEDDQCALMALK